MSTMRTARTIELCAATALACILLAAAVLKSLSPLPAVDSIATMTGGWGSPRLFVSLLSLAEWGLAVWLLSGITRRHAWVASGCAVFGIVIAAVILKTLAPDQSFGCFGGSTLDLPGMA